MAQQNKAFGGLAKVDSGSITIVVSYLKISSFGKKNRGKKAIFLSIRANAEARCPVNETVRVATAN